MKLSLLLILSLVLTGCRAVEEEPYQTPDDEMVVIPKEPVPEGPIEEEPDPEPESEKRISFYGLGDNLIHGFVYMNAYKGNGVYDFTPIYKSLADDIGAADIAYINQETVLGGDHKGFSGYPDFNTPSDMAQSLVSLGFDIVNGSNNHALDMGTEGLLNSLDYWSEFEDEVVFTGAFKSQEHRDTIPVIERDGIMVSFLTYTYGTNAHVREASYQVNYFDPDLITDDIKRAQEISDFVVVASHWGTEYEMSPNDMQLEYAQLMADLEVDAVIGSHPHVIQPVEWVEGATGHQTLVAYSLGDVVSSAITDKTLLGGSIQFDFVLNGEDRAIENIHFEPNVIFYETDSTDAIEPRTNFEIIHLKDFTPEHEQRHALNGYQGNIVTKDYVTGIMEDVIPEEFR